MSYEIEYTDKAATIRAQGMARVLWNYLEVLKPKESALLIFIGVAGAFMGGGGHPSVSRLLLASLAVALGSAGCNGLTNYLDREVDARMQRTKHRALPSKRIVPAEKVLPLTVGLVIVALAIAWKLNPYSFLAGLAGVIAAVVARKSAITHFLGGLSGGAPVAVGWLAIAPPSLELLFLLLLILTWVPIHVWSLMLAYREDYLKGGVRIFPVTWEVKDSVRMLAGLSILLYALSWGLYFAGGFGWLYLAAANVLGVAMIYASFRLWQKAGSQDAWKVYKLSAYPYLGLIFLAMGLDLLL